MAKVLICDRARQTATNNASGFTTSMGATYRVGHKILLSSSGIQLFWANSAGWLVNNLSELVVKAAVEIDGGPVAVTFNGGQSSVTIPAGDVAISDVIDLNLSANDILYTRTYVHSNGSGGRWPGHTPGTADFGEGITVYKRYVDNDDTLSDISVLDSAGNAFGFWPSAIFGETNTNTKVICGIGDSIMAGSGASTTDGGFVEQAARANGFPLFNGSVSGRTALDFTSQFAVLQKTLVHFDHVISNLGTNDLSFSRSFNQITTDITNAASNARGIGVKYYQTTLLPRTNSTDSWMTTENQTVKSSSQEAIRIAVNDWIRSSPSAIDGYIEAADLVETSRNSGIWAVPDGVRLTYDGIHPTQINGYNVLQNLSFDAIPLITPTTPTPSPDNNPNNNDSPSGNIRSIVSSINSSTKSPIVAPTIRILGSTISPQEEKISSIRFRGSSNVQFIAAGTPIVLESPYSNSEIRYTLNGKNPNKNSSLYSEPLVFYDNGANDTIVLKTRTYTKDRPGSYTFYGNSSYSEVNEYLIKIL